MSALPATLLNIQRGERTAAGWNQVHTYQVFTTDGTDGPDVVVGAPGLPAFGAALTYDPTARVSRITPDKQGDATNHWHVDVEYSQETANSQDHQKPPTLRPTKRTAKVRWVERALQEDRPYEREDGSFRGDPILTSAKTPFNPPITTSVPHPVVTFQRWEEEFTTQTLINYVGHVNSTPFGVYAPGWVLCTNIEASEEWEQDAEGEFRRYWLVTYEFEAACDHSDKFDPIRVLDADVWFIDMTDDERKALYVLPSGSYTGDATEAGAILVPTPVPISGGLVQDSGTGQFRLPTDSDDPSDIVRVGDWLTVQEIERGLTHHLEFSIYPEADFNELGLPVD